MDPCCARIFFPLGSPLSLVHSWGAGCFYTSSPDYQARKTEFELEGSAWNPTILAVFLGSGGPAVWCPPIGLTSLWLS